MCPIPHLWPLRSCIPTLRRACAQLGAHTAIPNHVHLSCWWGTAGVGCHVGDNTAPLLPPPCHHSHALITREWQQGGGRRGAALSPTWQTTLAHLCTLLTCMSRMQGGRGCAVWTHIPMPGGPLFTLKQGHSQRGCSGGSRACCPVRVSRGRGQRRGVAYLSHAALCSLFAHMGGVPQPPHAERGGNRVPHPAHMAYRAGCQQGGTQARATGQEGEGACKHNLHTPSFPQICVVCALFFFIFIYNYVLLLYIKENKKNK
jgi:hypothetical protein